MFLTNQETTGGARGCTCARSVETRGTARATLLAKGWPTANSSAVQCELSATLAPEAHSGHPSKAARLAPLFSLGISEAIPAILPACSTPWPGQALTRVATTAWLLCTQQMTALNITHQPNSTANQARVRRFIAPLFPGLDSDGERTRQPRYDRDPWCSLRGMGKPRGERQRQYQRFYRRWA